MATGKYKFADLKDVEEAMNGLDSIVSGAGVIQGAVNTFADLPNPIGLKDGTIYIVRLDTPGHDNGFYVVQSDTWQFFDALNFQDSDEVPNKSIIPGASVTAALDHLGGYFMSDFSTPQAAIDAAIVSGQKFLFVDQLFSLSVALDLKSEADLSLMGLGSGTGFLVANVAATGAIENVGDRAKLSDIYIEVQNCTTTAKIIDADAAAGVTLDNVLIRMKTGTQAARAFSLFDCDDSTVNLCRVIVEDAGTGKLDYGIYAEGCENIIVQSNRTLKGTVGIRVDDSERASVENNYVLYPWGNAYEIVDFNHGQALSNHAYSGNTAGTYGFFLQNLESLQFGKNDVQDWDAGANMTGAYFDNVDKGVFEGNLFRDLSLDGMYFTDSASLTCRNNFVHVCGRDGIYFNTNQYANISGNYIYFPVRDGYGFTSCAQTILNDNHIFGPGGRNGVLCSAGAMFQIANNHLYNAFGTGPDIECVDCTTVVIEGNICGGSSVQKVYLHGATTRDILVDDNQCTFVRYDGIVVEDCEKVQVKDNTMRVGSDVDFDAIKVTEGNDIHVEGNQITQWDASTGIRGISWTTSVADSSKGTISRNRITGLTGVGIYLHGAPPAGPKYHEHVDVENNRIVSPGSHGIHAAHIRYCNINGNKISKGQGQDTYGILIESDVGQSNNLCSVSRNKITEWNAQTGMGCIKIAGNNNTEFEIDENKAYQCTGHAMEIKCSGFSLIGNRAEAAFGAALLANGLVNGSITGGSYEGGDATTGGAIVFDGGGSVTLTGAFISGGSYRAVWVKDYCENISVTDNHIKTGGNLAADRAVIDVEGEVERILIGDNVFEHSNHHPIRVKTGTTGDPDAVTVKGNICVGCSVGGIKCQNVGHLKVEGNTLGDKAYNAGYPAIDVDNCDQASLQHNTIYDWNAGAGDHGIYVQNSTKVLQADNTIQNVGGDAAKWEDTVTYSMSRDNMMIGETVDLGSGTGNDANGDRIV